MQLKLKIELVPSTAWCNNLRSLFTTEQWDYIRKFAYRRANYRCEICGGQGPKHPVEAHEEWYYDEETLTMTLNKVTAICPACHEVKHIGLANINGRLEEAKLHLMNVNFMNFIEANEYINECMNLYQKRSEWEWTVNITKQKAWIEKIIPTPPKIKTLIKESQKTKESLEREIDDFIEKHADFLQESFFLSKENVKDCFMAIVKCHQVGRGIEDHTENAIAHYKRLSNFIERFNEDVERFEESIYSLLNLAVGNRFQIPRLLEDLELDMYFVE